MFAVSTFCILAGSTVKTGVENLGMVAATRECKRSGKLDMKVGVAVVPKRVRTALTKEGKAPSAVMFAFQFVGFVLFSSSSSRSEPDRVVPGLCGTVDEDGSCLEVVVQRHDTHGAGTEARQQNEL